MIKNYLVIAWRSLRKHKAHSAINIAGLAIGMAVAILIGLWLWDELGFDQYNPNYKRVAQVMQNMTYNGVVGTDQAIPIPLGAELRKNYGSNFKRVALSSWSQDAVASVGEKKLTTTGNYVEPAGPELFGLTMVEGSDDRLNDPSSILISQWLANALFGKADALNKIVRLDDTANFTVAGVYKDLPLNSTLGSDEVDFFAPWDYYLRSISQQRRTSWNNNFNQLFVELADNADMPTVSAKIKEAKLKRVNADVAALKPALFLHPMSKWHLYSEFKDGRVAGGRIQYVWLFGIIGLFVLLLACINFMNLSTARSEKRAKEVGIRKTVGSLRGQLVSQFFVESLLFAVLAFALSLVLAQLALPFFNDIAGKQIFILWSNPWFWVAGLAFTLFTGILAGSYPAFYLSSFRPVKVLKGGFKAGRFAALPRQILVVLQFTVSVGLIIGTIVVFKQIQFAKDRPVGYSREGLVITYMSTTGLHDHFDALRTDLLKSGAVTEIAESNNPAWNASNNTGDVSWQGMDPSLNVDFADIKVTSGYGKTIGWQFVQGRDFSPRLLTDSNGVILNETAVKYMGLKNPVGETIRLLDSVRTVIGVVKDMVVGSPFEPVKQTIYYLGRPKIFLNIRINPKVGAQQAVDVLKAVCKTYAPGVPFGFRFMDNVYAGKFENEERVGELAGFFTILAVFISCLGLFGMASYMAEQRVKEIGVRKVLGASVFNLWRLLSKDFVGLVLLSLLLAFPLAGYFMHSWLQQYTYRTGLGWWVFAAAGIGALLITLLTVSYQSIRAALANPVKSLRSE